MKTKPDWAKAPDGATHWIAEDDQYLCAWYKKEDDGAWAVLVPETPSPAWISIAMDDRRISLLIPRPTKPRYIAHYGGKCPDKSENKAEVVFRYGNVNAHYSASWWCDGFWNHTYPTRDNHIIAYRILNSGEYDDCSM